MNIDAPVLKDHIEKQNHFVEVINAEKLLWALIHSKGLLHTDVQDLYRKARSGYENIIVNDHEIELQDVEYYLWKLHYKHIDEYRKRIRQTSGNLQNSIDSHMEGFKSFLSEATEFYKDLIAKIKICCGLPEEPLYKDGDSFSVKSTKLHKFQYVLHRFLVCLGDLARYRELCKKTDIQNHKWSVAATYYLKATMVWPDSGNPQNQLALLATYVGDDFLALYHCVRSLAVKEPFPDAWDNLMLLFEKNTSSHFHSLSSEAQFDFLKPSERSSSNDNKLEGSTEHVSSGKSELWPLFVRMISFFFMKSSLEDFPCAFSSTMREFEDLLALDDTKLKVVLEAYEHLDSARSGPYRALQLVSVLIFIIHSLSKSPESKEPKEKNDIQQFTLTQLAWIATFICMGRLVERCLKGNHPSCCPFLGAVLVFVEWLVDMLDKAETYSDDERVSSAISYFFGAFGDFLNRIDIKQGEVEPLDRTALWEDYEMRGFSPIVNVHISLNFSTHWESLEDYDSKYLSRAHRILFAAMKFVENSSDSRKWISYDKSRRKFCATESIKNQYEHECGAANKYANDVPFAKGESVVVEEEEVILFKPITRYNSVPLQTSTTTNDEMSIIEGTRDQTESSDECIRRATSLRCNKPFKQPEPLLKDSATYPVGPPSLSAWVLNRETPNMGREKGTRDFSKLELSPIKEIASASLSGPSINDSKNSLMDTSPYVAPLPSAPLLPDDAVWFRGNSSGSSDCIKEADGILGAPPVRGYSHWPANPGPLDFTPGIPGFIDGYPPLQRMSSSEWLYQYTNSHNLERANNHIWPVHFNPPGNFYGHDGSRFDLFDRWGNPLISNRIVYLEGPQLESPVYGADEQRREKLFLDYQRLNPYGCGAGTELRAEQPPLLQYLKEREWQLERESQLRGPPYMGN